jgi:hypothetical protein
MRTPILKIRGIYATALTRLSLDLDYRIAQPSREVVKRFRISRNDEDPDISITDRDDRQGVRLKGKRQLAEEFIRCLWETLLDMVVRREVARQGCTKTEKDQVIYDLEFPGASKTALDALRARVRPTLRNHHRLRIIASDYLDLIEQQIELSPHKKTRLEHQVVERFVYQPMRKQGVIQLEHVKPEGRTVMLQAGEIISLEAGNLSLKRRFHSGRYDGLDLPIDHGDYAVTHLVSDAWSLHHSYFNKAGEHKGAYWNINTPIEIYVDHIRYVDLHVDVVRRKDEPPRIIDHKELESVTLEGFISPRLQHEALEVARRLVNQIVHST